ncbi:hypothetical protein HG15A2_09640 [Adhaeretor mobilis]|uniref:Uncharacterized protein n=2 Tax=Adhaeretor mobilis TaxID=1930276 RepID=A0A517MS39_9BACT|nr:hypothetical protein HG15A2_09640 [Adhaeretor mobilis]
MATVEESLVLELRDFRGQIRPRGRGQIGWEWPGGQRSEIAFVVEWGQSPTIVLRYSSGEQESIEIPIQLQWTATNFGGQRRWFTCPLISGDVACRRRVGKLYLPPGARYFGCRKCHRLTYESCNQSNVFEQIAHMTEYFEKLIEKSTSADLN